ncbi:type IV secretion system protein [Salinicola sp. NYA28a]
MDFTFVADLFDILDTVATNYAIENISNTITLIVPIISLGLAVSLLIQGLFIMFTPASGEPLSGLFLRFARYAAILAIAGAGGLYQTDFASTALSLPDQLSSALYMGGTGASSDSMGSVIDSAANKGGILAKEAFDNIGWSFDSIASLYIGVHILVSTFFLCGIGAAFILMAKLMLAIIVGLGPIFIFALMFDGTKRLFTPWIGALFNYVLLAVLVTAVFSIMNTFYEQVITQALQDENSDKISTVMESGILVIVTTFIMFKMPGLTSSITSGIAATYDGYRSASRGGGGKSLGSNAGAGAGEASRLSRAAGAAKSGAASAGAGIRAAGGAAGQAAGAILRFARQR